MAGNGERPGAIGRSRSHTRREDTSVLSVLPEFGAVEELLFERGVIVTYETIRR
jgi:hypothetical protein